MQSKSSGSLEVLFDSFEFLLVFFPLCYLGYLLCQRFKRIDVCLIFIIFSSLIFHSYYKASYTYLLLASVSFNYLVSHLIGSTIKYKKILVFFGVCFNIFLLSYFKYFNFIVDNINSFYGGFSTREILLPLGISFYTFQQIGFLVDCYKGEAKKYAPLSYFSYILFFPHLIAGPIIHHKDLISQLSSKKILFPSFPNILTGVFYIFIGLFKKVFLSDTCASYVDPIFNAVHGGYAISMIELWFGTILFSFVIYFDFSGYSDIAIGLARFFNVKFPVNFNSPYKSLNLIDFWGRWHITLSNFLKEYVYFSLGKTKSGSFRRYINIIFTMSLSGLWHGANWNFVAWGLFHGLMIVTNHLWRKYRVAINMPSFGSMGLWFSRIFTFLCVSLGWVFFRSQSLEESFFVFKGLFSGNMQISVLHELKYKIVNVPYYYLLEPALIILSLLFLTLCLPNSQEYIKKNFSFKLQTGGQLKFTNNAYTLENVYLHITFLSLLGLIAIMNINFIRPFIYFNF